MFFDVYLFIRFMNLFFIKFIDMLKEFWMILLLLNSRKLRKFV